MEAQHTDGAVQAAVEDTMQVYKPETRKQASHLLFVAPGKTNPDVSNWKDGEGKPLMFKVEFKFGAATVTRQLGKYLINEGIAKRSRLILPFSDPQ